MPICCRPALWTSWYLLRSLAPPESRCCSTATSKAPHERCWSDAGRLRKAFPVAGDVRLILNDRPDLALLCDFGGVHVGRDDVSVEDARRIVRPAAWVGVSTHSPQQVAEANETSCDYIAYGPMFPTATKNNHDPTVGLAGLRIARSQTRKPLVAIGGITRENCRSVLNAGADSVAVISGLVPSTLGPGATADCRRIPGAAELRSHQRSHRASIKGCPKRVRNTIGYPVTHIKLWTGLRGRDGQSIARDKYARIQT